MNLIMMSEPAHVCSPWMILTKGLVNSSMITLNKLLLGQLYQVVEIVLFQKNQC